MADNRQHASIEGPVQDSAGGRPFASSIVDLSPHGYREEEYFLSGTARCWVPRSGTRTGQDGMWAAQPIGAPQLYKTRLLARIPPPDRFSGTVVVEWMQELFGTERDIFFRWNAEMLLRAGIAWIGVSLHHEGVDGPAPNSLVNWDPQRYGSLTIPDSSLGYDILSQAARCLHDLPGLGEGKVKTLLAAGNSLSAWRLSTYVNAVQPVEQIFDGFFLQDFRQKTVQDREDAAFPHDRYVRSDAISPVLMLNMTPAAMRSADQPAGHMLRRWEPAGAAHTNTFLMARTAVAEERDTGTIITCCPEDYANAIPSQYFSGAAIEALVRWARDKKAPQDFAPIDLASAGGAPALDEYGNVTGGMRHPWVDVPVARYGWEGECVGGSGRTYPFPSSRLARLYDGPQDYHQKFAVAVRRAVRDGIILPHDAEAAIAAAGRLTW